MQTGEKVRHTMYNEILVPTDGSETTDRVLDHTVEIASERDARIHLLYVIDDQAFLTLDDDMKEDVVEDLRQEGNSVLDDAAATLGGAGLDVTTEITKGKPSEEIVAYVDTEDIDLVTMGTHGDDYTENMLGSTSQEVVATASAPVLTVNVEE
jgi:nucleotide-binding universal stress UspA family protein